MEAILMRQVVAVCTLLLTLGIIAWASPAQTESQGEQAALRKEAKISMRRAQKTALAKEPGTIKSKELEKENGKLIYSFDILTRAGIHEVQVDAITGEVVQDIVESKTAEEKEKQQDERQQHSPANQDIPNAK
jgi:hypothetical protein